jgi:hypothetical protein
MRPSTCSQSHDGRPAYALPCVTGSVASPEKTRNLVRRGSLNAIDATSALMYPHSEQVEKPWYKEMAR